MEKRLKLFDYKDKEKEIVVKDFENVKVFIFEILSGDGVLTTIYDNHVKVFDGCDIIRNTEFLDGTWVIEPKNIDVLNRMKCHDDTDELDEVMLEWK